MTAGVSQAGRGGFGLDAGAPGFLDDPYPTYHALRASDPVYLSPWGDWYLTRYADVVTVLTDERFQRASPGGANPMSADRREPTSIERMFTRFMIFRDPPDHTRLRGLLGRAFTPKVIAGLRPQIEALTHRLLDDAAQAASFDLVAALSYPLPVIVISRMLGIPESDYDFLKEWSGKLTKGVDTGRLEDLEYGAAAADELGRYMGGLVAARRAAPRQDLISEIIAVSAREGTTNEEELVANLVMLLWTGHETTKNLIGNGVLALLGHADQMAALAAAPELMPTAVEEFLRFDSPVQKIVRWTTEPTPLGAHTIPPGECIVTLLGAANRDPAVFSDPDRLDIRREEASNIAFGRGIHHCPGFAIARMEAEIAIGALLARTSERRLTDDVVEWQPTTSLRGPARLPLTVTWR